MMTGAGIYDKETGREIEWPSELIDKEMSREDIAYALGNLIDILIERKVIVPADVLYILPQAAKWHTTQPPEVKADG